MSLTLQKTNNIGSILSSFHRAADQALENTKKKIAEDARDDVPVESGELRDSIQVTDDGVEAKSDHALWIEIGTEYTSPQPFLSPAVQDAESYLASTLQDSLK